MKKIAFAFEGGGPKGAFHAGAVSALHEAGIKPDILTGISVGAINAAYYAQALDIVGLRGIWDASSDDVFKGWMFGYLQGIFKGSLKDSSPMRRRLEQELDLSKIRTSGLKLRVGAVSINSGEYELWDESSEDLIDGIMASAAHPVFLPYVKARDQIWTDGGVRHVTPLRSAVRAGADEVWLIRSGTGALGRFENMKPNLVQRTIREFEIILNEAHRDDLRMCEWINTAVRAGAPEAKDHREITIHSVVPSKPLEVDLTSFTRAQMAKLLAQGHRDGLAALEHARRP